MRTGSGKSYTMLGMLKLIAKEIFNAPKERGVSINLSVVEVSGVKCYDLLNSKHSLKVCDDGKGKTNMLGIVKQIVTTEEQFMEFVNEANYMRVTHATTANAVSS